MAERQGGALVVWKDGGRAEREEIVWVPTQRTVHGNPRCRYVLNPQEGHKAL
jgi:hypothetical protein